jgi:N-acylneuraminate cytidylyltransferase
MWSASRSAEVLAVVPARGGSKTLPRKNLRLLAGYPLIAHSITAGLRARRVSRVIVTTDDMEIAAVAHDYGAEVPFLRPAHLAGDSVTDLPVFQHALRWLADHEGYRPEVVVQLRPTSPLRQEGLVDAGVERLLEEPHADSVRSVTAPAQNPFKMWQAGGDSILRPLLTCGVAEAYNQPRQSLPPVLWQTGHLDVVRRRTLLDGSMTGTRILPLEVDQRHAVDIDAEEQLFFAEWLIKSGRVHLPTPRLRPASEPANGRRPRVALDALRG